MAWVISARQGIHLEHDLGGFDGAMASKAFIIPSVEPIFGPV
jgi:hypothetical protein